MGELSGTVTLDQSAVANAQVAVVDAANSTPGNWSVVGGDVTSSDGSWSVSGLEHGTERYHALVQLDDGQFYNAESLPYLSVDAQFTPGPAALDFTGVTPEIGFVPPDSVVHRYRFEGDGTDSVGDFDGTVEGGSDTFTTADPIEGEQSLVGDGTDNRLSLPSNLGIDATADGISFEFRVEFSSVASGVGVFSLDDQNTTFYAFFPNDGELVFGYVSSETNLSAFATGLQTGTLYDIVCQYDPAQSAMEVYVDGSLAESNSGSAALDFQRGNNNFGSQNGGSRWLSATRADDLRIHNTAIN